MSTAVHPSNAQAGGGAALGAAAYLDVGTTAADVAAGDAPAAAQAAAEETASDALAGHAADTTLHTTGLDSTPLSGAYGRFCRIQPAGATYTVDGFTSIVSSGTLAVAMTNTRANLQFTATAGYYGGWRASAIDFMRIGHGGKLTFGLRLPSTVSGKRTWIGMASVLVGSGSTAAGSFAGLLVEPTGEAFVVARDGTTQSTTSTGVTLLSDTDYRGYVRFSSSGVYVSIAAVGSSLPAETAHTTNLPAAGTDLGLNAVCYMSGATGSFQSPGISYFKEWE